MSTQNQTQLPLIDAWKQFVRSWEQGGRLIAESKNLHSEHIKLRSKKTTPYKRGEDLMVRSIVLKAEGSQMRNSAWWKWMDAVAEIYGKRAVIQEVFHKDGGGRDFTLVNGDVYTMEIGRS